MKKRMVVLLAILLASVMMLASCGEQPTPPTPEQPTYDYTVEFVVAGVSTKVGVNAGETPVYDGTVGDYADDLYFYLFTGWNKEIVPATEDTKYVAQYRLYPNEKYTVEWYARGNIYTNEWYKGQTPTPPTIADYEDEGYRYTFIGWDAEITPVNGEGGFYRARFSKEPKTFNVTFLVDGTPVATVPTSYGTVPVFSGTKIEPKGANGEFAHVGWTNMKTITGDTTCEAIFSRFDIETLETAIETAQSTSLSGAAHAAQLLAVQEMDVPGSVTDPLLVYIRNAIKSGYAFDLTPNFCFPQAAGALAVAKQTPSVWSKLTAEEIERVDLLMKSFAVLTAIGTDDANNYSSGPGFVGNYSKHWNPNYPLSNIPQIIFCVSYFGGAQQVNDLLKAFDYDEYVAKFKEYGWKSALSVWTHEDIDAILVDPDGDGRGEYVTVNNDEDVLADNYGKLGLGFVKGESRTVQYTSPKVMLMEGGPVYAITALGRISQYVGKPCGTGIGVPAIGEKGYSYKGCDLNNIEGIWNSLLNYNYSGGLVTSKAVPIGGEYMCYIMDGSNSPVQGVDGMMKEFNSGQRSSVGYCMHDFALVVGTNIGLEALGLYDRTSEANSALSAKVWIGNTDFLYKAEKGYVSYTGTAIRGDAKPAYGSGSTYEIWKGCWLAVGAKQFTIDDFEIPDPNAGVVENMTLDYAKPVTSTSDLTKDITRSDGLLGKDLNWWTNDFFIEFSLNHHPDASRFEIRLRSTFRNDSGGRGAILNYVPANGSIELVSSMLTPADESSPASIPMGEYGWHRVTIRYHQGASVNAAQQVEYSVLITVYIDGVEMGRYNGNAEQFRDKGWLLYGAKYSATAEGNIEYTVSTPEPAASGWQEGVTNNKVYCQIYRGGFYNKEGTKWFVQIGDMRGYCATAPKDIAKVTYELNGGTFEDGEKLNATDGYTTEYYVNGVTYYAIASRDIRLVMPTKEGYKFRGWYTNPEGTGDAVSVVKYNGGPVVLYAIWEADTPVAE